MLSPTRSTSGRSASAAAWQCELIRSCSVSNACETSCQIRCRTEHGNPCRELTYSDLALVQQTLELRAKKRQALRDLLIRPLGPPQLQKIRPHCFAGFRRYALHTRRMSCCLAPHAANKTLSAGFAFRTFTIAFLSKDSKLIFPPRKLSQSAGFTEADLHGACPVQFDYRHLLEFQLMLNRSM